MTIKNGKGFSGFSKDTISFLRSLKSNNNTAWFHAHKDEYNKYVLEPLKALVADLSAYMLTVDPAHDVTPAVGKTISRPNRDTRYSDDKSPYRTAMWVSFKRSRTDWQKRPVYFFEISISSYRFGIGFYSASSTTMKVFREMIDRNPKDFLKAVSFFKKQDTFTLEGEKYKRIFDVTKPDDIQDWYQRKSFYLVCKRDIDDALFSVRLVDEIINAYKMTVPLYNYLWKVIARQVAQNKQALDGHEEKWPYRIF